MEGGLCFPGLEIDPVFLTQIAMRWHHVTGAPCSRTPSLTSLSKPALTSSSRTGMGVWWEVGVACGGAFHKWECLVLAGVEGARLVGIKQVLLELRPVAGYGGHDIPVEGRQ